MALSGKLELTWVGKNDNNIIEKRVLIEDKSKSYGDQDSENMLIHGDNLLALKALEKDYAGKIKCIYIDPPYNTGTAFEKYDDNLEHSIWLSLMKSRLEYLKRLLTIDGSIWISIDTDECHYLKVLCDEIFGRINFIEEVIWQRSYAPINLKKTFSRNHDSILIYAKDKNFFNMNLLPRTEKANENFSNPDNDTRGLWTSGPIQCGPRNENRVYEIVTPSGKTVIPPAQYCWRYSKDKYEELVKDNRIYFGPNGDNVPRVKRFLSEVKNGIVPLSLWLRDDVGDNQEGKKEIKELFGNDIFDTPKPERLISRILTLATNKNDIVLDSFLGSGTTCAVAHKMQRKWIGIEMMETAYSHCKKRLDLIINGKDSGRISKLFGWIGGGGYHFYEISEPLFTKHPILGIYQINSDLDEKTFKKAVCAIEDYSFENGEYFDGNSSENHYIKVTRDFVNGEYIQNIINYLEDYQSVSIYCLKYQSNLRLPENIEIIDIMKNVLSKCVDLKEDK